jgi:hypothetical protein
MSLAGKAEASNMQECNSPRNSQLKTHSDETLGSATGPSEKNVGKSE